MRRNDVIRAFDREPAFAPHDAVGTRDEMSETKQSDNRTLRPAQLTASTLAALTGAFFAARLGVYGTVIGVGVMSLLSTLGTELYTRSLERTKNAAMLTSRARVGRQGNAADAAAPGVGHWETSAADQEPAGAEDTASGAAGREPYGATHEEAADVAHEEPADIADQEPTAAGEKPTTAEQEPAAGAKAAPPRFAGRLRWSLVAAGTAVTFVLAMMVITGIESVSGSTLSGAEGSTVGNLVDRDTAPDEDTPQDEPDAPAPEDEQPEPGSTEPGTDPTERAPGGDEEAEDESIEPPADGETAPPEEDSPPTDDGDAETDTPPEGDE